MKKYFIQNELTGAYFVEFTDTAVYSGNINDSFQIDDSRAANEMCMMLDRVMSLLNPYENFDHKYNLKID